MLIRPILILTFFFLKQSSVHPQDNPDSYPITRQTKLPIDKLRQLSELK